MLCQPKSPEASCTLRAEAREADLVLVRQQYSHKHNQIRHRARAARRSTTAYRLRDSPGSTEFRAALFPIRPSPAAIAEAEAGDGQRGQVGSRAPRNPGRNLALAGD